ncbi:recombinase family protein [Streptomyces atratus]|uniref:recombinase family protein n=1 Tax=Streptomyces atratus TaxID=1893 RepID=UPI0036BA0FDC
MLTGYCRISTADQSPDHQIDALLRAGVDRDNIHVDTASGAKASRPKPESRARDGHRRGLVPASPELLSEITRGALERLLTSQLPRELEWTAADLLRAPVDTVFYGAIHSVHPGIDGEQLRAVMPTARDDGQEAGA